MRNNTDLLERIGAAIIEKKKQAAKDIYDNLDAVDRLIVALCVTPATDSRIKQFFRSRDAENRTLNIDHKIQYLTKNGILGRAANKYVVNPEYREFITVMPMTASKKEAGGLAEDVISDTAIPGEAADAIRELIETNEMSSEAIAEEVAIKYDLDEAAVFSEVQQIERTGMAKKSFSFEKKTLK